MVDDEWKRLDERISYLAALAQRELRYGAMKRQQAMDLIWQTVRIRTNRHFINLGSRIRNADAAEA